MKSRCDFCKKKAFMPELCKYCEQNLCLKCLLPPKHVCKKISLWRSKDDLAKQLYDRKCVAEKVEKI